MLQHKMLGAITCFFLIATSVLIANSQPTPAANPYACAKVVMDQRISHPGCTTVTIPVTVCRGNCKSSSRPLTNKPWFTTNCECCRRTDDEIRTVELLCSDGATIEKNVVFVRDCECQTCNFLWKLGHLSMIKINHLCNL